jgi:hypothetical protein
MNAFWIIIPICELNVKILRPCIKLTQNRPHCAQSESNS